jgi:hypothetical protein
MKIASAAFENNGPIPSKYTCDGDDVSPPLEWGNVPPAARTVALICDDPDAPKKDFTHWVLFDMPAHAGALPERVPAKPELPAGGRQGKNDFGNVGYGGPCPPSGTHRYRFTLYAVDSELGLLASSTKKDVEAALEGHVLETAQVTGVYTRAK